MPRSTSARRGLQRSALATAALTMTAVAAAGVGASPATADETTPAVTSLFPTDLLTVADPMQLTGKRVNLPTGCDQGPTASCALTSRLDQLDGFDIDPRLALTFDAPVSVDAVIASTTVVGGGTTYGVDRVVVDTAHNAVYAHPQHQLKPGTTYTLTVSGDHGLAPASTTFTTMSATDGLVDLRKQLDNGSAYTAAGISAADRKLKIDAIVPTDGTVLTYNADTGSGDLKPTEAPIGASGTLVFGSFLAPSWLKSDVTIDQTPTAGAGPAPVGKTRLPFLAVIPAGRAPAGGWPTEVFGHGFSRSDADVLPASFISAGQGQATIATDVVGHGFGPRSTWTIKLKNGTTKTVSAYARGVDLDGNGTITAIEGSSTLPNGAAAPVSTRDALRQTAVDNMALLRAVQKGLDVSGTAASELRATDVSYFGQSFGGIYGTMVAGADPKVFRAVLNVAGGPVLEVARLSTSFRPLVTQALAAAGLLNRPDAPERGYFQEDMPLRGQGPVVDPAPGALQIQSFLAAVTWLGRPGSPETFAPMIRDGRTLFQNAFGDQTVPNPTTYALLDAGSLFGRSSLYRNDRTEFAAKNPHGFLLDIFGFGPAALQAQVQLSTFMKTGKIVDPDGKKGVWQVPATRAALQGLNFDSPAFP